MAKNRHLRKAPITEALVDLRATPSVDLADESVFVKLRERLSRYPKHSVRRAFGARFEVLAGQPQVPTARDEGLHGYFFEAPDTQEVAQFRIDGFTYNKLAPYTNGDAIIAEASRLWAVHVEVACPLSVHRIALRYINTLRLPAADDLSRYLTRVPMAPAGAPGGIQSYLSRVETFDAASGHRAITTETLRPGMPPGLVDVVIDIDAFRIGEFSTDWAQMAPAVNALRDLKNRVFFGSIMEEAAERYE
jgi:uncharacterized protein (TIGR04255 family)